jgi:hypothetical protein
MRYFRASYFLFAGLIAATVAVPVAAAAETLEIAHVGLKASPRSPGPRSSTWIRVGQPHTPAPRVTDVTMKRGIVGAPPPAAPNSGQVTMEKITIQHEGMNSPKSNPAPTGTRQITIIQELKPKGPSYAALDDLPASPSAPVMPSRLITTRTAPTPSLPSELKAAKNAPSKQHEGGNNGFVHKLPTRVK